MRELVYLASALDDLTGILEFVAQKNNSNTNSHEKTRSLRDQCARLAALPGLLGRPRPELRADIRSFPFKGYVIFFRYREECFEVVDILEGHRDIDAFFAAGSG